MKICPLKDRSHRMESITAFANIVVGVERILDANCPDAKVALEALGLVKKGLVKKTTLFLKP